MPLTLIAGNFSILNAAPDGDSVRFIPNNPALWKSLETRVRPNKSGGVQLRLDAIDALETHYRPRLGAIGVEHQPPKFGQAAAARLLDLLGFDSKTIKRGKEEKITTAQPNAVSGYILTRSADKYGRAVAFAFAGEPKQSDGESVRVNEALLKQSVNYQLVHEGLVYPTFYSKLYVDLRRSLTKAAKHARSEKLGIWTEDVTTKGFTVESLETITDEVVILPKLFRRLLSYLAINDGSASLDGLAANLEASNDRVIVLSEGQVTGFDNVLEIAGQTIRLTVAIEDLVFVEG